MDQVVAFLGIPGLKARSARQWKGPCPFCKGVDCFVVSNDGGREKTGAFNCFKCPAGGDQIELVSLSRGHAAQGPAGSVRRRQGIARAVPAAGGGGSGEGSEQFFEQFPPARKERRTGVRSGGLRQGRSIPPMRPWRGSASIRRPIGSGRRAMRAPASIAAGSRCLSPAKDGAIVGYFGRATKGESPTLTFPNGLNPQEHIFGADRVTSEPAVSRARSDRRAQGVRGRLRQRRLLPHRRHRRDPARSARRPDGRAQMRVAVVLLRLEPRLMRGSFLSLSPLQTRTTQD